jgi:hypothetical protein
MDRQNCRYTRPVADMNWSVRADVHVFELGGLVVHNVPTTLYDLDFK